MMSLRQSARKRMSLLQLPQSTQLAPQHSTGANHHDATSDGHDTADQCGAMRLNQVARGGRCGLLKFVACTDPVVLEACDFQSEESS